MVDGTSLLLPPPATPRSPPALLRNFMYMTLFFSVNHGCVTSVINLSVVLLGQRPGSFSLGALYVMYAATALFASTSIMAWLGSRGSLIVGTFVYCVYVFSLPLALLSASSETGLYALAVAGGGIGGVAAGFLWAAQGAYFSESAKLYAAAAGTPVSEANAKFAAFFGAVYLGAEVLLKMLPLLLRLADGGFAPPSNSTNSSNSTGPAGPAQLDVTDVVVAVTYSVLALGAAVGMLSIWDLEVVKAELARTASGALPPADEGQSLTAPPPPRPPAWHKAAAAVTLWCRRPSVLLLAPVQACFGLCAALLGDLVAAKVVPKRWPLPRDKAVAAGLLSAMVALVAASLQVPFKAAAARVGKPPLMLLGLSAFGGLSLTCLFHTEAELGQIPLLLSCYLLQGVGRASYEGTNKALYSDFFPEDAPAAFSNIVLANGLASAAGFFIFPELELPHDDAAGQKSMASIALAASITAVIGYVLAELLHRRGRG